MKITAKQARTAYALLSKANFVGGKAKYAQAKNIRNLRPVSETIGDYISEVEINTAMVDEKTKEVLSDESGKLKWTKEGIAEKQKGIKGILEKEVDFEPFCFPATEEMAELAGLFMSNEIEFLLNQETIDAFENAE